MRNVARVSYATSLMKQGVLLSTTEHVLAALVGNEPPDAEHDFSNGT